ncbi:hypothetical protein NEIELOOT_00132 [Neisseria elongata subsp. glycolytica ATCC 29315]|uniref:Uncharacterized protein n=1 Tax=Neisseria elongata subsp. glycolytica ATCC 29315 TaxID=546263 RepID=D4DM71_NEIEG|nr:hypothetical protein NEIELOOT_00132 [Neisseria elongata subsp. glycolytica ATCC 29315]
MKTRRHPNSVAIRAAKAAGRLCSIPARCGRPSETRKTGFQTAFSLRPPIPATMLSFSTPIPSLCAACFPSCRSPCFPSDSLP